MVQDTRKDPRAKVLTMTVRYKSATVDEFIEHHSHDVSRGGIFIKTPSPFPPGTLLKFEIRISEDKAIMGGVGRVVWKRESTQTTADRPAGMGVKFLKIDESSRKIIDQIIQAKGDVPSAYDQSDNADKAPPSSLETPSLGSSPSSVLPSSVAPSSASPSLFSRKATQIGLGAMVPPVLNKPEPKEEASFFPKQDGPSDMPPPEERTVMKQAAELLAEALKGAGGSMEEIDSPLAKSLADLEEAKAPKSKDKQNADKDAPKSKPKEESSKDATTKDSDSSDKADVKAADKEAASPKTQEADAEDDKASENADDAKKSEERNEKKAEKKEDTDKAEKKSEKKEEKLEDKETREPGPEKKSQDKATLKDKESAKADDRDDRGPKKASDAGNKSESAKDVKHRAKTSDAARREEHAAAMQEEADGGSSKVVLMILVAVALVAIVGYFFVRPGLEQQPPQADDSTIPAPPPSQPPATVQTQDPAVLPPPPSEPSEPSEPPVVPSASAAPEPPASATAAPPPATTSPAVQPPKKRPTPRVAPPPETTTAPPRPKAPSDDNPY